MSIRSRLTIFASAVVLLGTTALTSHAAVVRSSPTTRMCVISCDPDAHPGCTLCRGECSDENHTVGCFYDCTGLNCTDVT
jgi:hypothetical protein